MRLDSMSSGQLCEQLHCCCAKSPTRGCALTQPGNPLVAQLPADDEPGNAAMLHYTWGTIFKDAAGGKVWEFDKRAYTDEKFQRIVRAPGLQRFVSPPPDGACL